MVDPHCDPVALAATYRLFGVVNPLVASWRPIYRQRLLPVLRAAATSGGSSRPARVLDVGAGSGWTTALLAHLVGPTGEVVGVELEPDLARWGAANVEAADVPWTVLEQAELLAPETFPGRALMPLVLMI